MKPTNMQTIPVRFSGNEAILPIPLRVLTYQEDETSVMTERVAARRGYTTTTVSWTDVCEIRRRIGSGSYSRIHTVAGRCQDYAPQADREVGV